MSVSNILSKYKHPAFLFVLVGIILRCKLFFDNRSFWIDEAYVSLDIINKSIKEIITYKSFFVNQPNPPVGFEVLQKFNTYLFGFSEPALRSLPLICGMASLWLLFVIVRKYFDKTMAVIATALFAFADSPILYSATAKQYSLELLVSVSLLTLFLKLETQLENKHLLKILTVAGMLAPWFAYSSIFVLSAGGCAIILQCLKSHKEKIKDVMICFTLWAASFFCLYFLAFKKLFNNQYLYGTWHMAFPPASVFSIKGISWLGLAISNVFITLFGIVITPLAFFLLVLGAMKLIKESGYRTLLLVLPLAFVLLATLMHKYPLYERMVLFLTPMLSILIASGICLLSEKIKKTKKLVVCVLTGILLFAPISKQVGYLFSPREKEELRPMIEKMVKNYKEGDVIFLNHSSIYGYSYYYGLYKLPPAFSFINMISGKRSSDGEQGLDIYYEELNTDNIRFPYMTFPLAGYDLFRAQDFDTKNHSLRVWVLLSHLPQENKKYIVDFFDKIGQKEIVMEKTQAAIFLYTIK